MVTGTGGDEVATYSLAQIKGSYEQKKDWESQFPTEYFIFRPASFYLTYLIIRLTHSPSSVAWVGLGIGALGCTCLLCIGHLTIWAGILLLFVFSILDAVDGNIARVTGNVTYYGKYLDGMAGDLIEGSYWLWLALGLYFDPRSVYVRNWFAVGNNGDIVVLLAGVAIVISKLYGSKFAVAYYLQYSSKHMDGGIHSGKLNEKNRGSTYRKHWWYLLFVNGGVFNIQLIALVIVSLLGAVDLFLIAFALYYAADCMVKLVFYCRRAKTLLS
jgi:phosphatidylglycerophosphate synthase